MAEEWLDAQDAFRLMTAVKYGDTGQAIAALLKLLKTGAVRSIATRYDGNPPGLSEFDEGAYYVQDGGYYRLQGGDHELSTDFWGLVEWRGERATADWDFGVFAYSFYPKGRNCNQFENASGVRFELTALRRLVGETVWNKFSSGLPDPTRTPSPKARNSGGRPPAAFADDLMCAVWSSIYRGDLKPKRQAELERAIKDWAEAQGHELGDTLAREKARKIWTAMNEDVGNRSI